MMHAYYSLILLFNKGNLLLIKLYQPYNQNTKIVNNKYIYDSLFYLIVVFWIGRFVVCFLFTF